MVADYDVKKGQMAFERSKIRMSPTFSLRALSSSGRHDTALACWSILG